MVLIVVFLLIASGGSTLAQRLEPTGLDLINAPIWTDTNTGVALAGYDPVTFFSGEQPRAGRREHEVIWGGVAWWFENEGNRAAFAASPAVYAPRFGGHDALAMSRGAMVRGHPEIWNLWRGQLYVFRSPVNRAIWLKDQMAITLRAVEIWKDRVTGVQSGDVSVINR